ncbi:division/cell wall cluster transcriptional repressor MraZ [Dietzia timorensis]|uniref:Transcriptional regulator MraZ n=1 Tax=Dietzia timorensis TaxID=499555 RepID=A0A173LIQ6_9ACTN|nr:division/cell wall cluster transcriptional repressor MraZ [Dietzia timorensis]ANI92155.1 Protein MraZ [Dietzia timorensis]
MDSTDTPVSTDEREPVFVGYGTYRPRLDDKGRLTIPAKFRAPLEDGLVVCNWFTNALSVFPEDEFNALVKKIRPTANRSARHMAFYRILVSGADVQQLDKQGRISIPSGQRGYAGLDRDCVVNGLGERLEVWDATAWDRYNEENLPAFSEMEGASLGIEF